MCHLYPAATATLARCIRPHTRRQSKLRLMALALLMPSLALFSVQAQAPGSVKWTASATHGPDSEYVVSINADIQQGWHIYSATQPAGGPLPLVIKVEPSTPFELGGKIDGTKPTRHHDASFDLDTEFYTNTFSLKIPVKSTGASSGDVPISVRYQMCSDTICMPPKTIHLVATATKA